MQISKSLIAMLMVVLLLSANNFVLAEEMPMKTADVPLVEKYLVEGNLSAGESALQTALKHNGTDDQLRFGLGMLQFLEAVEGLSQDFYKYGLRQPRTIGVPILNLPVADNPEPAVLTYNDARNIMERFQRKLAESEATLKPISDPNVTLPLHFGMIRLDLNGDGRCDDDETLWKLYARLSNNTNVSLEKSQQFYIKFDRGDVHWLRGYCNLLMGISQMYLAYNSRETFDLTAHIFFKKVDSPYPFLSSGKQVRSWGSGDLDVLDIIALIHSLNWPVVEPKRMEAALHNFEEVVAQSRETWKWIMAETDDDHEWLPNPKQTGVIPNVRVTQDMVDSWSRIMDEIEKVLSGQVLIPFWRGEPGYGVNLRKVFLDPRTFDLVLWVQGSAAAPYLEKGPTTTMAIWREQTRAFGGQFPGFAVWFN